jgi:hypothetical protein
VRVFENRVLRRIFGPKREEVTGGGGNNIMSSFINIHTLYQMENEIDGVCAEHLARR